MRWTVLVPVKAGGPAKSRLAAVSADPAVHQALVAALRTDTVTAASGAAPVARVVLVSDVATVPAAGAPEEFVQTGTGLNAALREAAEHVARRWPGDGIAALLGDLPALRPDDLAAALVAAARHERAFVPDADGTGTTLLTAVPGARLRPAFGAGSAVRHGAVAVRLAAAPGLRRDVDTPTDLARAADLGLGAATAAVLASADLPAGRREPA